MGSTDFTTRVAAVSEGQIAASLNLSRQAVKASLRTLQRRGYITRLPDGRFLVHYDGGDVVYVPPTLASDERLTAIHFRAMMGVCARMDLSTAVATVCVDDIARRTGDSRSAVARALRFLEKRGHIRRLPDGRYQVQCNDATAPENPGHSDP